MNVYMNPTASDNRTLYLKKTDTSNRPLDKAVQHRTKGEDTSPLARFWVQMNQVMKLGATRFIMNW